MTDSAGKRRVAAQRIDRKAAKHERRKQRREEPKPPAVDEADIMSRFHRLNELRTAGAINEEEFERQRHDIFVSLGIENP